MGLCFVNALAWAEADRPAWYLATDQLTCVAFLARARSQPKALTCVQAHPSY